MNTDRNARTEWTVHDRLLAALDAYIEWYDLDEEEAAEDVLAMVADRFHGHEEEDTDERLDAAVDDALTDAAETPDPTSGFAGVLRSVLDG